MPFFPHFDSGLVQNISGPVKFQACGFFPQIQALQWLVVLYVYVESRGREKIYSSKKAVIDN